jgi:hypothetical protein
LSSVLREVVILSSHRSVVLTSFFLFLNKYLENVLESQHTRSRHIVEGVSPMPDLNTDISFAIT